MVLKDTVIKRILNRNSHLSLSLAMELSLSQERIKRIAKSNEKNNQLTTAACVEIIKKDMGIFDDSEVLEREPEKRGMPAS